MVNKPKKPTNSNYKILIIIGIIVAILVLILEIIYNKQSDLGSRQCKVYCSNFELYSLEGICVNNPSQEEPGVVCNNIHDNDTTTGWGYISHIREQVNGTWTDVYQGNTCLQNNVVCCCLFPTFIDR